MNCLESKEKHKVSLTDPLAKERLDYLFITMEENVHTKKGFRSKKKASELLKALHQANDDKTTLKALLKLSRHKNPEIRARVARQSILPNDIKLSIYKDLIINNGYENPFLMVDILRSDDIPSDLFNAGLQILFTHSSFYYKLPLSPDEMKVFTYTNLEYRLAEDGTVNFEEDEMLSHWLAKERERKIKYEISLFHESLWSMIKQSTDITAETAKIILTTSYTALDIILLKNQHITQELCDLVFDHIVEEKQNTVYRLLHEVARDEKTSPLVLERLMSETLAEPNIFSQITRYHYYLDILVRNPSTPVDSLITFVTMYDSFLTNKILEDPEGKWRAMDRIETAYYSITGIRDAYRQLVERNSINHDAN